MTRLAKIQSVLSNRRRRHYVDPQVQGALIRQAIHYWWWTTATFALLVLTYRVAPTWLSGSNERWNQIWYHLAPYMIASAILFPIVVLSAIRFSNRFVGPVLRFERTLHQLASGETPAPIVLRENDFWKDIAEAINRLAVQRVAASPADAGNVPVHAAAEAPQEATRA